MRLRGLRRPDPPIANWIMIREIETPLHAEMSPTNSWHLHFRSANAQNPIPEAIETNCLPPTIKVMGDAFQS